MDYVTIKEKKFKVKKKELYWKYYIDKEKNKISKIENLNLYNQNIGDIYEIEGLESLTNLRWLSLGKNKITEIKGLENLSNLEVLWLGENKITKNKGLESLTNLRYLSLNNNEITEIEGLEGLSNLGSVDLHDNRITEIKGLESLYALDWLDLSGNKITEIKGLENLSKLENLYLHGNEIDEITGLESFENLQDLDLNRNKISEIKGLERLNNLVELGLDRNQITEIKGLYGLKKLKRLNLSHNQIKKIKGLESLYELTSLDLSNNQIMKIEGLQNLGKLKSLKISDNPIPYDIIESLGLLKVHITEEEKKKGWYSPEHGKAIDPQKFVEYSREQLTEKRKEIEPTERDVIEKAPPVVVTSDTQQIPLPFKAYRGAEPFVFTSYAHSDKQHVYPIINSLNKAGINIWYDQGIPISENWKKSIAVNLEQSTAFLVFISPQVIDSEYVKKEISFALKKKKPFIGVYLQKTTLPAELEFEIADIQALSKHLMPETEFYNQLLETLYDKLNE